ncbi:MAG TPA: PIN domain-containing protein [archaeon]|nr:PIN domain-containing protein [archaeon]
MGLKAYFFDTYAFFEIINANPNYSAHLETVGTTTKLNLMELHYGLLREYGKKFADEKYDNLVKNTLEVDDKTIKEANEFRLKHAKKKLSYIDCVGYVSAKRHNLIFLTGDKEFKNMENVEFVK